MKPLMRCGAPPEDPRLGRIEQWDPRSLAYGAMDILTVEQKENPLSKQWVVPKWLDQSQEGACFPAGTYIRMADGSQKKIEEIRTLDEVATAEGRTGTVMQTMVRRADALVSITLRGLRMGTRCTPEHPILTKRGYIAAKDLVVGDLVAVTKYIPSDYDNYIDVLEVVGDKTKSYANPLRKVDLPGEIWVGGVRSKITYLPEKLEKTEDLGRLLGLYAAEGAVDANKVRWSYGAHEENTLVAETVELISSVLGAEARLQFRPNGSINVTLYGKHWRYLFSNLVPGMARYGDKRLSSHITNGPKEFLRGLVKGWFDGDGHYQENQVDGVSVCRQLSLDFHAILNGLGERPLLRQSQPSLNKYAKTRQIRYDLIATTEIRSEQKRAEQDEAAVWRPVVSVDQVETDPVWVYNFHVQGDESYVAEGLGVHNCVSFAICHELASFPVHVEGITDAFAQKSYCGIQKIDPWPGGACANNNDPYYEGTSILSGMKYFTSLGYYSEYRWAFSEREMMLSIGHAGPAVIGIPWYESMYTPDANGFIKPEDDIIGGHAILVSGIDADAGIYTMRNSWGRDYGDDGDCYMTREDMEEWLSDDGEVCIPLIREKGQDEEEIIG